MERSELFDLMGELQLYGMKAASPNYVDWVRGGNESSGSIATAIIIGARWLKAQKRSRRRRFLNLRLPAAQKTLLSAVLLAHRNGLRLKEQWRGQPSVIIMGGVA